LSTITRLNQNYQNIFTINYYYWQSENRITSCNVIDSFTRIKCVYYCRVVHNSEAMNRYLINYIIIHYYHYFCNVSKVQQYTVADPADKSCVSWFQATGQSDKIKISLNKMLSKILVNGYWRGNYFYLIRSLYRISNSSGGYPWRNVQMSKK